MSLLILATGLAMLAQPSDRPEPAFPSDGMDPSQAGGAQLLEAVCPGGVANGKEIECRTGCADFTDFGKSEGFTWSLGAVTRGHFLSPTSEDAVLWMLGCEPHSENFGGTVLLTRRSEGWSMLWYKAGVQTAQCHKAPLRNGREILVCMGTAGAQGNNSTDLYVEDLLDAKPTLMAGEGENAAFFSASDTSLTCGWNEDDKRKPYPVVRAQIKKVKFSTSKANGASVVSVTAGIGKKAVKPEEAETCLKKQGGILPPMKNYRMDFIFEGHSYEPAPSSVRAARIFKAH